MDTVLIIVGVLIALVLVGALTVYVSVRRNGAIARKITSRALQSEKVQQAVSSKLEGQLDSPELLEQMEREHGIDRKQAAQALAAYQQMNPAQRQRVMAQAAKMGDVDPEEMEQLQAQLGGALGTPNLGGVSGTAHATRTPADKRKAANRAKAKRAKAARKRSR